MFYEINAVELKAFVHCRISATIKVSKKVLKKFPKKGKFEEAMRIIREILDEDNLISLAYKNRNEDVLMT